MTFLDTSCLCGIVSVLQSWVIVAPVEKDGKVKQTHRTCASPVAETQTMSHIVDLCLPLTKPDGSLSGFHSADDDAVQRLANVGRKT